MVIYVHDTTHFSARIIEHIPHSDESKKITYSNVEYMQTTAKIQNYYGNIENRYVLSIFTIFLLLVSRKSRAEIQLSDLKLQVPKN